MVRCRGAAGAMFALVGNVTAGQPVKNIIGHAVAGCASAVMGDGDCGRGAVSAAAGAAWSNYVPQSGMWGVDLSGASLAGGLTSTLSGGSLEEGAFSAAYGFSFNEYIHRAGDVKAKYSVRSQRGCHIVPFGSTTEMDIGSEARAYWGDLQLA